MKAGEGAVGDGGGFYDLGIKRESSSAREGVGAAFHLTLRTRPDANHIAHFRKVVCHGMAALGAGFFGLFNHWLEVAEVEVFEHTGKIAREPGFVASFASSGSVSSRLASTTETGLRSKLSRT